MVIQHNMTAANTNRQLGITNANIASSTEKLSSGYKINRAADNAAGLKISEKMRGQIRGLDQASTNSQDGISLVQTAEGALTETTSILQRMRELAVQAANDTNVTADRNSIADEMSALESEITRIGSQTEFNTMKLLNGDLSGAGNEINLQVGANSGQNIAFSIGDMRATALGVDSMNAHMSTYSLATAAVTTIQTALDSVTAQRSNLGAIQNRLEHTIANADNTSENLSTAESRIRDVDMASEMVTYSKDSILQSAAQSMLAQANQASQGVLQLLQ